MEHLYCDCPFFVADCEDAWNCDDIYTITVEIMNFYDTNYNGEISLGDEMDGAHYDLLAEFCDYNEDGVIDSCEAHGCV